MYSDPRRGSHYCSLLRDQETIQKSTRNQHEHALFSPSEILLADVLGNHILWNRSEPALNCPAHADELATVSTQIYLKAISEIDDTKEKLKEEFTLIESEYIEKITRSSDEVKQRWLKEKIYSALSTHSPQVMQGLRLIAALRHDRAYSIENFRLPKDATDAHDSLSTEFFPSAFDARTGDFKPEIRKNANEIEKFLIQGSRNSDYRLQNIRNDALALAHLCWLNADLGGKSSSVQVRFVTGAPHVHRLRSLDSSLCGLAEELKHLIRHPLGLIDEIEMSDGHLGRWLQDRISPNGENGDSSFTPLSSLSSPSPESTGDGTADENDVLIKELLTELEDLLKTNHVYRTIAPDLISQWIGEIIGDSISAQAANWSSILSSRMDSLRSSFVANIFTLQSNVILSDNIARNLPPLDLPPETSYSRFCHRLYKEHARISQIEKEINLGDEIEEIIQEDSSDYTPLLAAALWRAAGKNWYQTRSLTRAAIGSVSSTGSKSGDEGRDGDGDARYLHAVALRITAGTTSKRRSHAEKDPFETDINNAFMDFEKIQKKNYKHHSEMISLKITLQIHERLTKRSGDKNKSKEKEIFDAAQELSKNISLDTNFLNTNSYTYHYTLQQCYVAMAHAIFLDRYALSGEQVFSLTATTWSKSHDYEKSIARLHQDYCSHCHLLTSPEIKKSHGPIPVVSSLVKVVLAILSIELNANRINIKEKEQIKKELSHDLSPKHHVATIDAARFSFFKKIAERYVGSFQING